jgi:alpha-beta hydrolase superfamily lysophospholipase
MGLSNSLTIEAMTLRTRLLLCLLLLIAIGSNAESRRPRKFEVVADGHPLSVWVKRPAHPRGSILLLHGRTWCSLPNFDLQVAGQHRSIMDALSERGYAVYALDQRGYGATPRDATGWLTPLRAAKDVVIVLQRIAAIEQGRRPVLLGYSRGSVTALFAAQLDPEAMSKLVLYAFVNDIDEKNTVTEDSGEPARQATTAEMAASDFITPASTPAAVVDAYVRQALSSDPIRVDWRHDFELNDVDPSKVRVPTLIIHGALDPRATAAKDMKLLSRLGTQDRSLVVLPSADHAAHLEDPQTAWLDAVVTFVERPRAAVK